MGENMLLGLDMLMQPMPLLMLVVGVVIGFAVGVLPGFASSNAAAILLPFTLAFSTEIALLFLVGIYAGASFASGVPAILLNVPGTGSAAATALDGYPMTLKGEANRAIGIARTASAVGGLLASIAVLLAIGPMAGIAIQFGSVEMFVVALFGLSIIGTVVGDTPAKGLLSGFLGMLIAAMSADRMMGQERFTLGFPELYDEVPFIPALIGLFALSQMFLLATKGSLVPPSDAAEDEKVDLPKLKLIRRSFEDFLDGVRTTFRYPREIIRASAIGTGIGIIPGAGTAVATFVAYGEAKRHSKTPERFGKGAPEGVIAAEASENATTAGTLVPTLALGIPGSATAAIMLAALYLHGILPGPRVLTENASEAYAVILGLGLASLLILPLGLVLATPMTAIVKVPPRLLVPLVIVVCMIGAYAVRGFTFDIAIAVVFGIVGVLMKITGYPVVPLVLGMILGPLAERSFVRALMLGDEQFAYFFERPLARVLWGLLAISILYNLYSTFRGRPAIETPRVTNRRQSAS